MNPSSNPDPLARTIRRTFRTAIGAGLLVIVSLMAVSVYSALSGPGPARNGAVSGSQAMTAVAPGGVLDPRDVPPALQAHYESARHNYRIFEQVPCFCGCEEMLGHRHLEDCFIRPDGQGLEAHALGCGVCLGEAQQVSQLLAEGVTDPGRIREAVIADWGDPYKTKS